MPISVAFTELEGSPKESWTNEGFKATMRLLCAWSSRNLLAIQCMQYGGVYYDRLSFTGARARSVSIEPFPAQVSEANPGFTNYEAAIVTIEFDTKGPEGEELFTETWEPTTEFVTVGKQGLAWTDETPLTDDEAPGMLVRGGDYKLSFAQLPYIPSAAFDLAGTVNSQAFFPYSLSKTFPAGTLLFCPPTFSRVWTVEQAGAWKVDYRFSYREAGWNSFYRAKTGTWDSMLIDGEAFALYESADFNAVKV